MDNVQTSQASILPFWWVYMLKANYENLNSVFFPRKKEYCTAVLLV